MARRLREKDLESKEARRKLAPRGKPYFKAVQGGVHLGYRRIAKQDGTWVVRRYVGDQGYVVTRLASADDISDSNKVTILSFWEAVDKARDDTTKSIQQKAAPITVQKACEDYLKYKEGEGANINDARKRINAHIIPSLGHFKVTSLKADKIRDWRNALAASPALVRSKKNREQQYKKTSLHDEQAKRRRRSSANRVLTILKAALNFAFDEEKVSSNAAWGRRVKPFPKADSARVRYLQIAEAARLINAADSSFRPLVQAALETGARYGEIRRLRVADYNPDTDKVFIQESKNGRSRHVQLTDQGAKFFKQTCRGRDGDEVMFKRPDGGAWKASQQDRPMKAACQRAKIKPVITFHGLRHTWASHAVMAGVPLTIVAENLGHAKGDTRMVQEHYAHLEPSYVDEAIQKGAPRYGFTSDKKVVSFASGRR